MKKEDIFEALGDIDAEVVLNAAPKINKVKKNTCVLRIAAVAACVALLVSAVVISTLLLNREDENQPDVSTEEPNQSGMATEEPNQPDKFEKYKDSEYIEVIRSLDSYFNADKYPNSGGVIAGSPVTNANVVITDNQVDGIEESDKIKRTETHIFYMDKMTLKVFSIDGENSSEIGSYTIKAQGQHFGSEILLSEDGKTVTVISDMYGNESFHYGASWGVSYTEIHSLDVSDPTKIVQKAHLRFKGSYESARVSEGKLLLFMSYTLYDAQINYDKPSSFLPVIDRGNGFAVLPDCEIICMKDALAPSYKIAILFDENDLTIEKNIALLSYSRNPYVTANKIFFKITTSKTEIKDGKEIKIRHTDIICVDYAGEDFKMLGSVKVEGSIKDQWSMDEYNGILRVVTGTSTSADLYCISLESFDIIASVKGFAPENEIVQSVRFDGTKAYVCTAINSKFQFLDPVFFFDLSDLNNISYKETGTHEGMSTSLVNFGNGCAIGIGQDILDKEGYRRLLKIEAYKEAADGVVVVDRYELSDIRFSTDYKSYYIDRKNKLVGFGYSGNWNEETESFTDYYALIKFDFENEKFIELLKVELKGEYSQFKRSVYIDGYLYMFGENDFKVEIIDLDATANE